MKRIAASGALLAIVVLTSCFAGNSGMYRRTLPGQDALAKEVLQAIAKNDSSRLARVLLTEREYKEVFWKSLPDTVQNAMPLDFAWSSVKADSRKAMIRYLSEYGGKKVELKSISYRYPPQRFSGFTVARGMVMEVMLPDSSIESWRLLNVVLEQNGRYKVIAFND